MTLSQKISFSNFVILVLIIVSIDQIIKYTVSIKLPLYDSMVLIPKFLNIVHSRNSGCIFGFLCTTSIEIKKFLFLALPAVTIIMIVFFYKNITNYYKISSLGLSFITGGAIGNTIDRFRLGEVIDFIDFYIFYLHYPTFNIADVAILLGSFLCIIKNSLNLKHR